MDRATRPTEAASRARPADGRAQRMRATESGNHGGGNSDWEARVLKGWATRSGRDAACRRARPSADTTRSDHRGMVLSSELRLAEVLEGVCSTAGEDKHACYRLLERAEQIIERWFFAGGTAQGSLERYLCYERVLACCAPGHAGRKCAPCPGLLASGMPCSAHGRCIGDGERAGARRCACDPAYASANCSVCAPGYYRTGAELSHPGACSSCDRACAQSCRGPGPAACDTCSNGHFNDSGTCRGACVRPRSGMRIPSVDSIV